MKELQEKLNYQFKNEKLLKTALTHSSYANENHCENNERLEFLGDSILGLTVSRYLFGELANVNEGSLSKLRASLVCEESLAQIARGLELGKFLRLGNGEVMQGGRNRNSLLSDALEAVFAAIYLDSSFEIAEKKIKEIMSPILEEGVKGSFYHDYKTTLQEVLQKKNHLRAEYEILREVGPDHNKQFIVGITIKGKLFAKGKGQNKKEAEQSAAKHALEKLGVENEAF